MILTEEHCAALVCIIALKSFARGDQMEREGLGAYTVDNPTIKELISSGFLAVNKAGSITPDKNKIRAELLNYTHPQKYKLLGTNSHSGFFKRTAE